jgi:hypothetical protein
MYSRLLILILFKRPSYRSIGIERTTFMTVKPPANLTEEIGDARRSCQATGRSSDCKLRRKVVPKERRTNIAAPGRAVWALFKSASPAGKRRAASYAHAVPYGARLSPTWDRRFRDVVSQRVSVYKNPIFTTPR